MGGHIRCRHADLLGADGLGHVLPVEQDVLGAVLQADIQFDLGQQGGHSVGVLGIHAGTAGIQTDGPVHGTGVHIGVAQVSRQTAGHAGLAGPGRAVDGNRDHEKTLLFIGWLPSQRPPQPGRWPRRSADCTRRCGRPRPGSPRRNTAPGRVCWPWSWGPPPARPHHRR